MFLSINVSAIELPEKTDKERVNLYLFYGKTCSHCHNFIEYFLKNYKEEYEDYFQIVAYETWYNDENDALARSVKDEVNITSEGVPFIIVGDEFFQGFREDDGENIISSALNQYVNKKYEDIVASVIDKEDYAVEKETLKSAAVTSGLLDKKEVSDDKLYFEEEKISEIDTSANIIERVNTKEVENKSINYYFYSTIFFAITTLILSIILAKNKFFTKR